MPLYEYERADGTRVEMIYSISERPDQLEDGARLVPSIPAPAVFDASYWKAQEAEGVVRREPGIESHAKQAKKEREEKRQATLREAVAQTVKENCDGVPE